MNMKRMRGRSHRHGGGGPGPTGGGGAPYRAPGPQQMNRSHVFDSNGPDMRLRGTSQQLFEKYLQLGRDATGGGDRVMAESYFQHAEHYFRILNAMSQAQQQHQGGPPQGNPGPNRRYQNGPEQNDPGDGMGEQPDLHGHSNGHAPQSEQDDGPEPDQREPH
jgi:Domain of unknown function (DUF4167)